MKRMIPAILIAAFFAFALTPVKCSAGAEVSVPKTVKIVMVGDILLHSRVEEAAMDANGNYNFDFIFANMKSEIAAADIAIVNEEVILGGKELGISGYPSFNAPWEVGDALINAGFDVVCHATNHALDKGKNGITNTLSYWEKHPEITVVGINKSAQEREAVTIIEKNGIRIAILNYTYGTNGISMPKDMPYAVNLLDADKVNNNIKVLNRIAEILKKFKAYKVTIVGHANKITDNPNEETVDNPQEWGRASMPLSKERADAIKAYLTNRGVSAGALSTDGMGGTKPVVNPKDKDNNWKNRRVEFILQK